MHVIPSLLRTWCQKVRVLSDENRARLEHSLDGVVGLKIPRPDDEAARAAHVERFLAGLDKLLDREAPALGRGLRELDLPVEEHLPDVEGGIESLGRPHVARALVSAGHAESVQDAFDRYLVPGMPAYIRRQGIGPREAIAAITAAGGIASLAHSPWAPKEPEVIAELREVRAEPVLDGRKKMAVAQSHGAQARVVEKPDVDTADFLAVFRNSNYFAPVVMQDMRQAEEALMQHRVDGIIGLRANFARDLQRPGGAAVPGQPTRIPPHTVPLVRIGTPIADLIEQCGGYTDEVERLLMGGPMMGRPVASLDVPVLKGCSGVLVFTATETARRKEYPCIRCGRCVEACPYFLNPSRLARLSKARLYDEMKAHHVFDCVECGCCTFACPSNIPIVQLIRTAKDDLSHRKEPEE